MRKAIHGISTKHISTLEIQRVSALKEEHTLHGEIKRRLLIPSALEYATRCHQLAQNRRLVWEKALQSKEKTRAVRQRASSLDDTAVEEKRETRTNKNRVQAMSHMNLTRPIIDENKRLPPRIPHPNHETKQEDSKWDRYVMKQRRRQRSKQLSASTLSSTKEFNSTTTSKTKDTTNTMNPPVAKTNSKQQPFGMLKRPRKERPRSKKEVDIPFESSFTTQVPIPIPTNLPKERSNGWIAVEPKEGEMYYYHKVTRQRRWTKPNEAVLGSMEERIREQQQTITRNVQERKQAVSAQLLQNHLEMIEMEKVRSDIQIQMTLWETKHTKLYQRLLALPDISPVYIPSMSVSATSSFKELKRSYMAAVRILHPDKLISQKAKVRFLAQNLFLSLTTALEEERPV